MGGKLSPLIIVVLIAALIGVGVFAFKLLTSDSTTPSGNEVIDEVVESDEPVITLSKEVNEEDASSVVINVYATMENEEDSIKEIILPDNSTVVGDTASFTVEKNGTYEFKIRTTNGKITKEEIEVTEVAESSATNPYVPEGFSVVQEDVDKGYTIEDEYGNQYVWVPVPSGKLTRNTMINADYEESSSTASALVNSVGKYYGFYIGKYEASQYEVDGQVAAASMSGKIPWTNITYLNAVENADNAASLYGYTDCKTALLNSYAWDTVLAWIDKSIVNYSSTINYGNYSGTIYPTGYTETDVVNGICDVAGNVREWTTEIFKSVGQDRGEQTTIHRVVRAGSASLSKTPASRIYYPENTSDNYWGFRTIIYK